MRLLNSSDTIQAYVSRYDMASFLNEDLLKHLEFFRFPPYSSVYVEEQEQHYLYFLVEGQLQCSHYQSNGNLAVFALSEPFCAIGDLEILTKERVYSNVIALKDTCMLGIARPYVEHYGANDPRFLRFLIEQLREKLYKADSLKMHDLLPAIKRFAIYLLSQQADSENRISLPEKEALASLMGTSPRHLNRIIKQLIDSQMLSANYPCVRILDRAALETLTY